MRKVLLLAVMLILPVIASADSTSTMTHQGVVMHHGTTSTGHPYFTASQTATGEGKIIGVHSKKREVSILTQEGDTLMVTCGPEVKNFAQIKKGDMVKAKYTEVLTIHVQPEGTAPPTSAETSSSTAAEGKKPSGSRTDRLMFSGTITGLDMTKGTVTLKGEEGHEFTLRPRNKENLKKVKIGDVVVFNYQQTVAASVVKVKK